MIEGKREFWPEAKLELAEEMWRQGYKAAFIAVYCDTTRNAVIGQANRRRWVREIEPVQTRVLPTKIYKPLKAKPRGERIAPPHRVGKISVLDLNEHTCRWPVSGSGAATLFCGKPPSEHGVYCLEHRHIASRPASPGRIPVSA